jgi:hypothetical protein
MAFSKLVALLLLVLLVLTDSFITSVQHSPERHDISPHVSQNRIGVLCHLWYIVGELLQAQQRVNEGVVGMEEQPDCPVCRNRSENLLCRGNGFLVDELEMIDYLPGVHVISAERCCNEA